MKRKIFSKLLMVALVIAAVGSFVSCKDYDDDINNLQKQIDNAALKSSVEALEKTLNDKIAAAQSAAQAAQTAADKAATTANAAVTKTQLDDAISAAKTAAQTAAETYADKVAAAAKTDAAKDAYDQAKAYVDAEVAKVTAAIPSEAAIKAIADASAAALDEKLATELKTWVNEQIDAIDVKGQVDEAVAKAIEKIDTAAANVAAIWSAVTSVELKGYNAFDNILDFRYGTVAVDYQFGSEYKGDDLTVKEQSYKKGDEIKFNNELLVRVNPVNATFTKEDVAILNSKEEQILADLIEIGEPVRFEELVTYTRSENVKTGLWRIPVTLKDGVTDEQLEEILGENKGGKKSPLLAVAINNTKDAAAARYAISDFEIRNLIGEYKPLNDFNIAINGTLLKNIGNRWAGDVVIAEDGTKTAKNPDYKWKASTKTVPTPAALPIVTEGKTANAQYEAARYSADQSTFLKVEKGEDLVLSLVDDGAWIAMGGTQTTKTIERYYVVFDYANAIESAPSEWTSWKKYGVEGLGEIKKSNETLTITIPEAADGDILGFRVYAINYDGTLADPDGQSFYVQYGEPAGYNGATATASWKATTWAVNAPASLDAWNKLVDNATAIVDITNADKFDYLRENLEGTIEIAAKGLITTANPDGNNLKIVKDDCAAAANDDKKTEIVGSITAPGTSNTFDKVKVHYILLKSDGKAAGNWNEAAKVKLAVANAGMWLDGATLNVEIPGKDSKNNDRIINKLVVSLTKVMPDNDATGITWKAGTDIDAAHTTLKLYMTPDNTTTMPVGVFAGTAAIPTTIGALPAATWNAASEFGFADLNTLAALDATDVNGNPITWKWTFKNATYKLKNAGAAWSKTNPFQDDNIVVTWTGNKVIQVPAADFSTSGTGTAADPFKYQNRWTAKVGDGNAYETVISRTVPFISHRNLGTAAAPNVRAGQDYDAPAQTFNTYFVDPIASQTFTFSSYQYASELNAAGDKYVWATSNKWNIQYNGTTVFTTINPAYGSVTKAGVISNDKMDAANTANYAYYLDADARFLAGWGVTSVTFPQDADAAIYGASNGAGDLAKIFNYVIAKNDNLNIGNGTLASVATKIFDQGLNYIRPFGGDPSVTSTEISQSYVTITSDANNHSDYYYAKWTMGGALIPSAYATNPATLDKAEVPSTITINVRTAFGRVVSVKIPVTIKR